jgi:tetratricopeptide (TPR) repeat protein
VSRSRRASPRSVAAITGAAFVIAALAWFFFPRAAPPALPRVEGFGAVAPEVAEAARQALADLAQDPRDAQRWGRFGMVCEANGLVAAARDAYTAATSIDGEDAKWWYRLAFVEARTGRIDEAIQDVRRAIEINPSYTPAHQRLGLWLLDRNDTDEAEREFTSASELDSRDISSAVGLARVHLQREQPQRAVDVLERALANTPGDHYAMQLLGTAYGRLGRVEEARYALAVGVTGEPAWPDPWTDEMLQFRRGFAVRLKDATQYFVAGQMTPAIALLEQLRQERPDDIALLVHLGEAYVVAGRTGEGIAILERAVTKDPQRFEAYVNLATGYLNQNDLPRALASVDKAIAINPALGRAYQIKGLILWRRGDEAPALDSMRTAVRSDPRDVRALVWSGMLALNIAKPTDALDSFARATRLDPTRAEAWVGVANAAMTLRQWDRATAALQHAGQLAPDAPMVKAAAERLQSLRR